MGCRYLSINTREKMKRPVDEMTEIKNNPALHGQMPQRDKFDKNLEERKANLEAATPPDVTETEKDGIKKRLNQLTDAMVNGHKKYVPPMPNELEMQKAPTGSVDKHMRWENFWKKHTIDNAGNIIRAAKGERGAIFEWKDYRRILAKGFEQEAPNYCNVEMIRPAGGVPLADTHVPVSYGLSSMAKAHYEEVFPDHELTPVEQKITENQAQQIERVVEALQDRKSEKRKRVYQKRHDEYTGPRCPVVKADGTVCNAPVVPGKDYCFSKWHQQKQEKAKAEGEQSTES